MVNEDLQAIINHILDKQLGKAIAQLNNYLLAFAMPRATQQFQEILCDYGLMADYWKRGFQDPQRERLYMQLLRRMFVLTMNVCMQRFIHENSYVSNAHQRARSSKTDWTPASLRHQLEGFVSDVALLEFEPEHTRSQRRQAIHQTHQRNMELLFDYIWTSQQWTDGVTEAFEGMLLSPTIDTNDQQLIVSAVTVSLINFFDINKFRLLISVYLKTTDEHVRQRALTGWVMGLDEDAARLYTEIHELVKTATEDERCVDELAELQMQMVYCLRAESDTRIIQSEIMPELMKNNNIRVTRNGIEEVEDDPMEDILHPEHLEERMEKLETYMHRMIDMQRQGSDIYFGGFSQMKRFPFFNAISNWFMPFYMEHPLVANILEKVRGGGFLKTILKNGPFCDSDKYSFVIAFETAVSKLPANILSMLDRGEATLVGGELGDEDLKSPAFIRRSYLQTIYRFYKVFPSRSVFVNPFGSAEHPRYAFFANHIFQNTGAERKFGEVTAFFVKHGAYEAAKLTLQNYRNEVRDAQFYLLNGNVLMRTHTEENVGLTLCDSYAHAVELAPENERAWSGYARALFGQGDYANALSYYMRLVENHPDNQTYQLNAAVCLTNMGRHDEALKMLYKLNYENPDNVNVNRVMAWALVGAHKYAQADKMYDELCGQKLESIEADDLLNDAYCKWFSGNTREAAHLFKRFSERDDTSFDVYTEFFSTEADMISSHGISEVEKRLMADQLVIGI